MSAMILRFLLACCGGPPACQVAVYGVRMPPGGCHAWATPVKGALDGTDE
jgi:hypothetical protein